MTDVLIERPKSSYPELIVTVPDDWPYVQLAPLYDVHFGHRLHVSDQFLRHVDWLSDQPYVLGWNGGDLIENAVVGSPGIFDQKKVPQDQFDAALEVVYPFRDKLIFAIPGNHEARTARVSGIDIARIFADKLGIPYFSDYCFATIKWRGNNFRICAHHGTGAAQTPGGQRNAARKDMPWVEADLYWTGHLHQPMADLVARFDFDQKTNLMVPRDSLVIISPSYLGYFGGYGAAKRLAPGVTGLIAATLQEDGRIDVEIHAHGRRL